MTRERLPLTLKERQDISLMLLKKLHTFCEQNGIRYSLAYGTLIGAIRHKGFIPWDDDIDVMMLRPDYERFCATFQSAGASLLCHQNEPDCFIGFARICDDVYTYSAKNSWLCGGGHTGVWIDIFPVDNVEDDPIAYQNHYCEMQYSYAEIFRYRARLNGIDRSNRLKTNILAAFLALPPFRQLMKKRAASYLDNYIQAIKRVPFGSTSHFSQLAIPGPGSKNYLDTLWFDNYFLIEFEDSTFYVMEGYDYVLRSAYGDYMQLPPEDQRKPLHDSQFFFWKQSYYKNSAKSRS